MTGPVNESGLLGGLRIAELLDWKGVDQRDGKEIVCESWRGCTQWTTGWQALCAADGCKPEARITLLSNRGANK